jgi:hypothetical protein
MLVAVQVLSHVLFLECRPIFAVILHINWQAPASMVQPKMHTHLTFRIAKFVKATSRSCYVTGSVRLYDTCCADHVHCKAGHLENFNTM